jgi:4-hydroxythreonine-4-phosphate dehydrogenase
VTVENILQTLRITHAAELAATGRVPHMGVAGLNPHAGEGGLSDEELDIIVPALQQARAEGLHVSGPFAPDTAFHEGAARGAISRVNLMRQLMCRDKGADSDQISWS